MHNLGRANISVCIYNVVNKIYIIIFLGYKKRIKERNWHLGFIETLRITVM